jgi:site-specific recombinase XerD
VREDAKISPLLFKMSLGQLWLDAVAAERRAAASTLQPYHDDLACYFGWLVQCGFGWKAQA